MGMSLGKLPLEGQTRVMFLHNVAFGGDSACKTVCKGSCCKFCASAGGYVRETMNDREWANFCRKYGFNSKTGFKGEEGCRLPIKLRSSTCLTFMCSGTTTERGFGPDKDKPFKEYQTKAVEDMMDIFIEAQYGKKVNW